LNINILKLILVLLIASPLVAYAIDITGTGSMLPVPLIKAWGDSYVQKSPSTKINYQGSSPADGIKRLIDKEVDFSGIDMPLNQSELNKNELIQFPVALGAIVPVVNLPNVSAGLFRLDGKTLGDIFLGTIKKWDDPEIAALNPGIKLPSENIILIHRASPPGLKTIIGAYISKNNPQWKSSKGDTMSGTWPASAIEVKSPAENFEMMKKTKYSIGYGTITMASDKGLSYVKLKNVAGNFITPDDASVVSAAESAKWDDTNGYDVDLIDQSGAHSWPLTMATFVLLRKDNQHPEHNKEICKFLNYSLHFGTMNTITSGYIPMPKTVQLALRKSLDVASK
jgi:phosphate transport system substrate-binding protein